MHYLAAGLTQIKFDHQHDVDSWNWVIGCLFDNVGLVNQLIERIQDAKSISLKKNELEMVKLAVDSWVTSALWQTGKKI